MIRGRRTIFPLKLSGGGTNIRQDVSLIDQSDQTAYGNHK